MNLFYFILSEVYYKVLQSIVQCSDKRDWTRKCRYYIVALDIIQFDTY